MEEKLNLAEIQAKLVADLEEVRQNLEEEKEKINANLATNPDRSDLAYNYASMDRRRALIGQMEDHLEEIQAALERIENGTFGICTSCGNPIAPARVMAIPQAELCVTCQSLLEG
jgi:RNA polymerase-binding protein DksA